MTTYEELMAEAERLTDLATQESRRAGRLGLGESLLTCAAAQPLLDRARGIRSEEIPETSERSPAAPSRLRALPDARSRDSKIRSIAAGLNVPAADLSAALADDITVEAFALEAADRAVLARAAIAHEADIEATAMRIIGSDNPYVSVRALRAEAPPPAYRAETAEAVAARINAA